MPNPWKKSIEHQVSKIENLMKAREEALKGYLDVQITTIRDLRQVLGQFIALCSTILTFITYFLISRADSSLDKGFLITTITILLIIIVMSVGYLKDKLEKDIEGLNKAREKYDKGTVESIKIETQILERMSKNESFEDLEQERERFIKTFKLPDKKGEPDYTTDWLYRLFVVAIICFFVGFVGFSNILNFITTSNKYFAEFYSINIWLKGLIGILYLVLAYFVAKILFRKTEKLDLRIDIHPSTMVWSCIIFLLVLVFWPIVLLMIFIKLLLRPFSNLLKKIFDRLGIENKSRFDEE